MRIVRQTARRVFKSVIAAPKIRLPKATVRKIIPGSAALNHERKIAEAIAARSNELRGSLSTLAREHAEYLDRCDAEKRAAKAAANKEAMRLASLKAAITDIENKIYDDKRSWLESKKQADALQAELVKKIADAKAYAEDMKQRRDKILLLEEALHAKLSKREAICDSREKICDEREVMAEKKEAANKRDNERIRKALVTLSEKEFDCGRRETALVEREKRAGVILAREAAVAAKEERVDAKAQKIQEDGKVVNTERANLARMRARLGRIKHLKKKE